MKFSTYNLVNKNLLKFTELDGCDEPVLVYTIGYKVRGETDFWSNCVMSYKKNQPNIVEGLNRILFIATKQIITLNNINDFKIGVVSAIPHDCKKLQKSHRSYIACKHIADEIGLNFLNNHLSKKLHRALHLLPSACERDDEISNTYEFDTEIDLKYIIILDDIVTRGTTMREVRRAIKVKCPKTNFLGLALAKSVNIEYECLNDGKKFNHHLKFDEDYLSLY